MITENFNILNELKEAGAEKIIAIGKGNCFYTPENYFNTLPETVMAHIFLQSVPPANPFTVPSGYFDEFASAVFERIAEHSLTVATPKINTYTVPEEYFKTLADGILNKIKGLPKHAEVEEEMQSISPLLSSIPKVNVYKVPDNYFEKLNIPSSQQAEPAKVISMAKGRRWISYAAAACVAVLIFGGGYFYTNKSNLGAVAAVTPAVNVEEQISVLSDEEIASYLQANSNMSVYTSTNLDEYQSRNNMDLQNMLQNVSDEEIQQYLEEDPESKRVEEGI